MPCPSVQASRPRSASLAAFWRSCCGVRLSFSEDDCTEYQESAALVDCSAVYRAVLLTLSRVAASRTLSPLAMCSRARCNLSAVTTGFRPPFLPRAAAAVNPALVRSRIKSRSNWPSAPNTWKMSRPPGGHCCKVSDEAAFCLIQRPYISKTLLTRRISPRGSP